MREGQLIDVSELAGRLEEPDLVVIDCRFDLADPGAGWTRYCESHIKGAVFSDLDQHLSRAPNDDEGRHPLPDPEALAMHFRQQGIDQDSQVVVYDQSNSAFAVRCWWLLRWLGHDAVRVLNGGLNQWLDAGEPVDAERRQPVPGDLNASVRRDQVLTVDDIMAAGNPVSAFKLFDARDPGRFAGEHEPIDAVAGHIPGAINFPLTDSLNPDGTFKSDSDLVTLWTAALGAASGADWGVMCGSGVTACHLALSAVQAGLREPKLYAGSWSEWIRDPDRPIRPSPH